MQPVTTVPVGNKGKQSESSAEVEVEMGGVEGLIIHGEVRKKKKKKKKTEKNKKEKKAKKAKTKKVKEKGEEDE